MQRRPGVGQPDRPMLDPRRCAILIRDREGRPVDRTTDVAEFVADGNTVVVRFLDSDVDYPYGLDRVLLLTQPRRIPVPPGSLVMVPNWTYPVDSVPEVIEFPHPAGAWRRVFPTSNPARLHRADDVQILTDAGRSDAMLEVKAYWDRIVATFPENDPTRYRWDRSMAFIHPQSALALFVGGPAASPEPALS